MNFFRRKIVLVALALLTSGPAGLLSGAVDTRTYASGKFELTIDGVSYGNVRTWSGGEFVADIVNENGSAGGVQKKHVANIHVAPLRVELLPDDSAGLLALMNEVLTDKASTHTVTLFELDFSGKVGGATEYLGTTVAGLELSAYDASSKDTTKLALVFQAEQVRKSSAASTGPKPGNKQKSALASNFRFDIEGPPGSRVASVSALSVHREAAADAIGLAREPGAAAGKFGFANLILSISAADLAAWQAWADSFLVQGNHLDGDEKKATLTQLEANLTAPIFTVEFSHVGLVRLSRSGAANTEAVSRFEVELYYEGATIAGGASGTATASKPPDQTTGPTNTATSSTPGAGTGQAATPGTGATSTPPLVAGNQTGQPKNLQPGGLNPTRQASLPTVMTGRAAGTLPVTPVAKPETVPTTQSTDPLASGGSGVGNTSAADPADQGVRDPREFMRIAGLVRRSYYSVDQEATSEESVIYASKLGIDDVVARYEAAMKGAGWEESRKDESGSASDFSHYYHLKWTKTVQEADLRMTQTKAGGTEMTIAIYTRRAGILSGLASAMKGAGGDPAAAEGSPNDQGARDPAEFPRVGRSTRKSYSSYGSAKTPEENAVYRAKLAIASVEAFYVNQLNQADWEQSVRRESGDPLGATHEITLNWAHGKRSVKINLKEIEPAITEITLSLSTSAS